MPTRSTSILQSLCCGENTGGGEKQKLLLGYFQRTKTHSCGFELPDLERVVRRAGEEAIAVDLHAVDEVVVCANCSDVPSSGGIEYPNLRRT
jgi:hypothetical protein